MKVKTLLKILIKVFVSFIFIYAVVSKLDLNQIVYEFKIIKLNYFILAALLYLSTMLVSTKRWSYFVKAEKSFFELFQLYMVGTFFNLFLPGTVGGDVVKAYYLYKGTQKRGDSLVSVFMERYMGLLALLLIATVSIVVGYNYVKGTFVIKFFIIILLVFIGGTIFVSFFPYEIFYKRLKDVRLNIRDFIFHRRIFLATLFLSLIVQALGNFVVYLLAESINMDLPMSIHFMFVPVISVISMIPVSFSGIGLREYLFLHFYGLVNITKEKAVILSILWFVVMVVTGIVGMIFYIKLGFDKNKLSRDK